MSTKRTIRQARRGSSDCLPIVYACEALEPRTLFNVVAIGPLTGNGTITLSSHTHLFRAFVFQFVDWSFNGGPMQSAQVFPGDSIFVDTGAGEDQVNVLSTPPVHTLIQGDSPSDDILNVGGPGGLQGIHGGINLTDTAGFWDITLDDSADTTSRTGILANGILSSLAPADIIWDPNHCHGLAIDTSSAGGNALSVLQTNVSTQIRGHSSGPDDSITVGNSADGLDDITSPLTIGQEAQVPAGLVNLTLDDQANPVGALRASYLLDNGALSRGPVLSETPLPISWNASALRSLTVKTQSASTNAAGEVRVESTSVPTTVVGDSPSLQAVVGDKNNNTDALLGNLYITNPAGATSLEILDFQGHAAGSKVTFHTASVPGDSAAYGAIDGMAPAMIAYKYTDTAGVDVFGTGGDNVAVAATGTNLSLIDVPNVTVGDAGTLHSIAGTLSVESDTLTIDDSADSASHQASQRATLTRQKPSATGQEAPLSIDGLSPGSIHCFSNHTGGANGINVIIDGGAGDNFYLIAAVPQLGSGSSQFNVTLNTGTGNDVVSVTAAVLGGPLTINGQGSNDVFGIFYGSDLTSNVNISGDGSGTLILTGPTPDASFSVAPGAITFGTTSTTYMRIKTLILSTGDFAIVGDLGGIDLKVGGSLIDATTVNIEQSTHLGALSYDNGPARVELAAGPTALTKTLFCTSLSMASGSKLDLANNSLQLTYSGADPAATIRSYLTSGYNNGTWNGSGIITSAGDATHALGFGDSSDGAVAGLPANSVLVRWTRLGDVNLDGKVGFTDLLAVARNYGKTGQNWDQGDVNYDGAVGFDDLIAVARNYGASAALQSASAAFAAAPLQMPVKTRKRR